MRIVVNHLTRMKAPRICVAGIDPETLDHIRPTTPAYDPITRDMLDESGGPFRIGALVDLGDVIPEPTQPETEDHRFDPALARRVGDLDGHRFLELLDRVRAATLEDAFGPELERLKWKYAVESGSGAGSLAVVRAERRTSLTVDDQYGGLTLRFNDPHPPAYLSVTDVRFFEPDQSTMRRDVVDDVSTRLKRGVDCYLMVGLTRAFQATGDDCERHWLQVNGIVLADRPTGNRP